MKSRYRVIASLSLAINGALLIYMLLPALSYLLREGFGIETYFAWRDTLIYLIIAILHFAVAYGLYRGGKEALVASFTISFMGLIFFITLFPLQFLYALALVSLFLLVTKEGKKED